MSEGKNVLEPFRDVAQDLLVPELKAVKVSIEDLRADVKQIRVEMKQTSETLRGEIKQSNEALRQEMKLRFENMERMITYRDQRTEQLIRSLGDQIDTAVEIRERLAPLEARMPRQ